MKKAYLLIALSALLSAVYATPVNILRPSTKNRDIQYIWRDNDAPVVAGQPLEINFCLKPNSKGVDQRQLELKVQTSSPKRKYDILDVTVQSWNQLGPQAPSIVSIRSPNTGAMNDINLFSANRLGAPLCWRITFTEPRGLLTQPGAYLKIQENRPRLLNRKLGATLPFTMYGAQSLPAGPYTAPVAPPVMPAQGGALGYPANVYNQYAPVQPQHYAPPVAVVNEHYLRRGPVSNVVGDFFEGCTSGIRCTGRAIGDVATETGRAVGTVARGTGRVIVGTGKVIGDGVEYVGRGFVDVGQSAVDGVYRGMHPNQNPVQYVAAPNNYPPSAPQYDPQNSYYPPSAPQYDPRNSYQQPYAPYAERPY